ncbi:retrovirus-related pol polyprotein from transposon TNT 1-94 [Tanacetum coccineum]
MSKDIKSKNSILKNTKSSSTYVWKTLNSACLDYKKSDIKTLNVCQTNACISNSKTVKACVNVVKDGSNIVCISCGNDVFLNSHEKCVVRHALSTKSSVKRALFTSLLAAKSKNLGATSVVTKSRLSVAKTPTATRKVSSALTPSSDSRTTRTLSSYMNNKIATRRKWQKWFEYQHGFNWTPRSKSAQSQSSVIKSKTSVRPKTKTHQFLLRNRCSKHMTGNLQLLRNFIEKFMGTVLFRNDHFAAITGYGDYVYFLRTKDEAPDMIIDFVNQVQRNLKAQILTIQTDNGTEFKNEKLRSFYAKLGIVHKTSITRTSQQNGVVE